MGSHQTLQGAFFPFPVQYFNGSPFSLRILTPNINTFIHLLRSKTLEIVLQFLHLDYHKPTYWRAEDLLAVLLHLLPPPRQDIYSNTVFIVFLLFLLHWGCGNHWNTIRFVSFSFSSSSLPILGDFIFKKCRTWTWSIASKVYTILLSEKCHFLP